jgi:hypothetical protein
MIAQPWPNNLGWDVADNAEVWKLKNGIVVRIFTDECRIKTLYIPDPSLDPVLAVERCQQEGQIVE